MGKVSIYDIYDKYYSLQSTVPNTPKMRFPEFLLVVSIDPTASAEDNSVRGSLLLHFLSHRIVDSILVASLFVKGKYLQWLMLHRQEYVIHTDPRLDTSGELTKALYWFDYNKAYLQEKDIYQMDVHQLLDLYHQNETLDLRARHEVEKAEQKGASLVYSDDDWAVVVPHTFAASCFYGQFTKWCTTCRDDTSYFEKYSEKGPLYICIDRHSSHKYQFYFVKGEYDFRNEIDNAVYPWDVNLTPGAKQFFKDASGSKALNTDQLNEMLANGKTVEEVFDRVYPVSCGLQLVKIDMRYNFVDPKTNQLVGRQWYFYAEPFEEGFAKVWIQRFTYAFIAPEDNPEDAEWIEDYDEDAWTHEDYYK
ncbi:MAG: hypothetical protein MJZ02_09600 [Paludibacteraceae bacterium]|nr:hypothetical protein [Paludibacteraceae bacterium]